ncbi:energy transducer TonB [Vulcanimicrobium alpinum]|uniref:energy transducer TonB n=1 Tax=Vulcanimicrobium alpinum TaxID=3016050 RepID=UPI00295ED75F|nr:energy transducer TonB [Vulcanimicrobium alpinum]
MNEAALGLCPNPRCENGRIGTAVERYPGPGEYCPLCGDYLQPVERGAAPPAPAAAPPQPPIVAAHPAVMPPPAEPPPSAVVPAAETVAPAEAVAPAEKVAAPAQASALRPVAAAAAVPKEAVPLDAPHAGSSPAPATPRPRPRGRMLAGIVGAGVLASAVAAFAFLHPTGRPAPTGHDDGQPPTSTSFRAADLDAVATAPATAGRIVKPRKAKSRAAESTRVKPSPQARRSPQATPSPQASSSPQASLSPQASVTPAAAASKPPKTAASRSLASRAGASVQRHGSPAKNPAHDATTVSTATSIPPAVASVASALPASQGSPADATPTPRSTPSPLACSRPDLPPTVLRAATPETAPMAQLQGVVGTVRVVVSLNAQSRVVAARVESSPSVLLNRSALAAARTSQFKTQIKNCEPVAADFLFDVTFQ